MKIIKRVLSALSVLLLVFALVGCSKNSSSSKSSQSSNTSNSSQSSDKDTRKPVKQTKYKPHIFKLDISSSFKTVTENGKTLTNSEEEENLNDKLARSQFMAGYVYKNSKGEKDYMNLYAIVALNKVLLMPLPSEAFNLSDKYKDVKRVYNSRTEFLKVYKNPKANYSNSTYAYKSENKDFYAVYDFSKFRNIPFRINTENTEEDDETGSQAKSIIKLTKTGKAKVQTMYNEWPELVDDKDSGNYENDADLTLTDEDFTFTNGVSSKGFKIKYKFNYSLTLDLENEIKEDKEHDSDRFDD